MLLLTILLGWRAGDWETTLVYTWPGLVDPCRLATMMVMVMMMARMIIFNMMKMTNVINDQDDMDDHNDQNVT